MAFLNKLLINTMIRAAKDRDPQEVAARQSNSTNRVKRAIGAYERGEGVTKGKKRVPDYSPMPGTDVNYGGGFMRKITPAIKKAIMDGAPDRNRGPKTGFGGFGMGGGTAVPNVKGDRSNLPPMSLAEILARRNIDFNPFQAGRQGLPQGQPMPPQGQPPQAQPQPEMVGFLSKLVQQGVYPDLATAFRATMSQPNQSADMGAPMGDRGPSGIASMLPLVAGRLFGGGR